uniref:Uncharacterized protein n=1 Tax=Gopherus evgoodei TaxID=1825980 RepID=A0A8C4Y8M9_9SAUR
MQPLQTVISLLCVSLSCRLSDCGLTDTSLGDLATALRTNQSLTVLNLGGNKLGDAGVQLLCDGLKHSNCKLHKLDLKGCGVTATGCGDLAPVLRTNQSLTELSLRGNNLGDAGVQLLCKELKHPNCKLQTLDLRYCGVTAIGCGDLAPVLRTSQSLTELKLRGNNLGDAGVRLLCKGLKHLNCKLQKLYLGYCGVTATGCKDLAPVLRTSHRLTELNLWGKLGDAGVRLLCKGLKHPNCKLQKLHLGSCGLTAAGFRDLAAVLSTSQSLKELDLGANNPGDAGVQLLCEGLKQLNCKLQSLLWSCGLTETSCRDLAAVLRTSQSLTELDLSDNKLGVSGVRLLCEGLKHPNSFLDGHLPGASCEDLAAVLRAKESLTDLDLGYNYLGDAGMQRLCKGLSHPNCKLQRLGQARWSLRVLGFGEAPFSSAVTTAAGSSAALVATGI